MQVQLTTAMEAAEAVAGILKQYSGAITATAATVAAEHRRADRAQADLDSHTSAPPPGGEPLSPLDHLVDDGKILLAKANAEAAKSHLATLAGQLAAAIDEQTAKVAPNSASLTPAQVRRQVEHAMGLTGLNGSAANGGLTTAQKWRLMGVAGKPGDRILNAVIDNADGEHAGGPVSWMTTDVQALQDLIDTARADGLAPKSYAGLLAQYWAAVAAEQAGIDLNAWDPADGVAGNRSTISAVYTFYGKLFLADPDLQWTGMANMIGPSFAGGFLDLDMMKQVAADLGGPIDKIPGFARGLLPPELQGLGAIANMSAGEFAWFEQKFLAMQKHIFLDQGAMHMAYTRGGTAAIDEMRAAGLIDSKSQQAWHFIDTGVPSLVSAGNTTLLDREQNQIINKQYDQMRSHDGVVGQTMTYLMTAVGSASIPGTRTPGEYKPLQLSGSFTVSQLFTHETVKVTVSTPLPDFNVSDKDSRWDYVVHDTLPAYQKLLREHPDQARAIISTPIDARIDEQRLLHRWPQLVKNGITDWDVDVDGDVGWGPGW